MAPTAVEQRPKSVADRSTVSAPLPARQLRLASWADYMGPPGPEPTHSRRLARLGGVCAALALALYLTWRVAFTLDGPGINHAMAWCLIIFEALPLIGLLYRVGTLWTIDSVAPPPVDRVPDGMRVTVFIPTYNEPVAVIAPTIAAACALDLTHETWVLDDGDRPWVRELAESCGARYVTRPEHSHAKAGNINNALALLAQERGSADVDDIIAVLDCDHVPLPHFLSATLGWFADPHLALVQGPQSFYNAGAFDDDGSSGEQGLFFNVQMPARAHAGAAPFWCGSTSLIRMRALEEIGGVTTGTITEDLHTTLTLVRAGWMTAYHHQTLAVGLAPNTPSQYLLQRRRWGMGAMQILVRERLWRAKRWMSWRTYLEYLSGTLWWLEGLATILAFAVPVVVLVSGAQTSSAPPFLFMAMFALMFTVRLWGTKRLLRKQIHWPTAFALRVLRVTVGMSCAWWLITRRNLEFEVTPKGGSGDRQRGRVPRPLTVLFAFQTGLLVYATMGALSLVPWKPTAASTAAAGTWILLSTLVLAAGTSRIRSNAYATSRREAHRHAIPAVVYVNGEAAQLVDVSTSGVAVRSSSRSFRPGPVDVQLPGPVHLSMYMVRAMYGDDGDAVISFRLNERDWRGYQMLGLWLFRTPARVVAGLRPGLPAVAILGLVDSPTAPVWAPPTTAPATIGWTNAA